MAAEYDGVLVRPHLRIQEQKSVHAHAPPPSGQARCATLQYSPPTHNTGGRFHSDVLRCTLAAVDVHRRGFGRAPSISVFSSGYLFVLYPVLLLPSPPIPYSLIRHRLWRHASHHITLLLYTPPRAMMRVDLASGLDRSDLALCATRTKPFLRGRPSNAQHSTLCMHITHHVLISSDDCIWVPPPCKFLDRIANGLPCI